jgi:hypothetical protein
MRRLSEMLYPHRSGTMRIANRRLARDRGLTHPQHLVLVMRPCRLILKCSISFRDVSGRILYDCSIAHTFDTSYRVVSASSSSRSARFGVSGTVASESSKSRQTLNSSIRAPESAASSRKPANLHRSSHCLGLVRWPFRFHRDGGFRSLAVRTYRCGASGSDGHDRKC